MIMESYTLDDNVIVIGDELDAIHDLTFDNEAFDCLEDIDKDDDSSTDIKPIKENGPSRGSYFIPTLNRSSSCPCFVDWSFTPARVRLIRSLSMPNLREYQKVGRCEMSPLGTQIVTNLQERFGVPRTSMGASSQPAMHNITVNTPEEKLEIGSENLFHCGISCDIIDIKKPTPNSVQNLNIGVNDGGRFQVATGNIDSGKESISNSRNNAIKERDVESESQHQTGLNKSAQSESVDPIVDSKKAWLVVIATLFIHLIVDGTMFTFGILAIELEVYYNTPKVYFLWIASIQAFLTHFLGFLSASLVRGFGEKPVIFVGCIISSSGYVIAFFANLKELLFLFMGGVVGFGFSLMYLPSITLVQKYFDRRRVWATGISFMGNGLGVFLLAPIISTLVREYGWRGTLLLHAGLMLNGVVAVGLVPRLLNERQATDKLQPELKRSLILNHMKEVAKDMVRFNLLRENRMFAGFCIATTVSNFGLAVPFVMLPGYASQFGISGTEASLLVSIMGIGSMISRFCSGLLGDNSKMPRQVIYGAAIFMAGFITVMVPNLQSFSALVVYSLLYGIFTGAYISIFPVALSDLVGNELFTKGMGIILTLVSISILLALPLAGLIFDLTNDYVYTFLMGGLSQVASGSTILLLFVFGLKANQRPCKTCTRKNIENEDIAMKTSQCWGNPIGDRGAYSVRRRCSIY